MIVSRVTAESLNYVWSELRPKIQSALSKAAGVRMTESYYYEQVKSGRMVMWVGHENDTVIAGGIISVHEYPAQKVIFIEVLAGKDIVKWLLQIEDLLREFQQSVGATTIEALCRPGLVKKLRGWRKKAILMEF